MKLIDILARAGRSLKQAKLRTLLTSLAIGVGAFTLSLALAAGNGTRNYIDDLVSSNADTQTLSVVDAGLTAQPSDNEPQEYGSERSLDKEELPTINDDDIAKLQKIDGVESAIPNYEIRAQYVTRDGQKEYSVNRITDAYDGLDMVLAAGQVDGNNVKPGQIVIPDGFLDSLGFKDANSAIGQTITVRFQNSAGQTKDVDYEIAAVETKPEKAIRYQAKFTINSGEVKSLYDFQRQGTPGYGEYMSANVQVKNGADVAAVDRKITDEGYESFSARELQEGLFQFIDIVQWGVAGFGGLAILAAIFGIINTQYISVLERTRQIGLMKSLGMRGVDVLELFLFEAAWIGFLGGVIGAGLAWVVTTLANPFISDALSLGDDTKLLMFAFGPVAILIASLIIIAMLAGLFPAWKAARLDPVEALRTE